jgi:hypothetical protein
MAFAGGKWFAHSGMISGKNLALLRNKGSSVESVIPNEQWKGFPGSRQSEFWDEFPFSLELTSAADLFSCMKIP